MQLHDLPMSVILLVIAGVLASVAAYTMSSVQTNICTLNTTTNCNTGITRCCIGLPGIESASIVNPASNATYGIGTLASWMPTISVVIAASIIIGLVVGAFILRRQ